MAHGSMQIDAFMKNSACLALAEVDGASLLPADYLSNNKIDNTVVLTGDIHTHWVGSCNVGVLCIARDTACRR